MKRLAPWVHWVLAGLLGVGAGVFLARREPTPVEVTEKLAACEAKLVTESAATDSMARSLNQAEADGRKACDERVDKMLAERKP
jgi:hypothetical protein